MRYMDEREYIKTYCDNKYRVFEQKSKHFPRTFEQTAYHDVTTWYDAEHDITIEARFYIGD